MRRIKQISLLVVLLTIFSSCSMRSALQIRNVSDLSFNPFGSSEVGFSLNIDNNLKKTVSIESGTITVGEQQNIVLRVIDPIRVSPSQEKVPIKLSLELTDGASIFSLIPLVKEMDKMPVRFDGYIRFGNRKKTYRIKKSLTINVKELLSRIKL